MSVVNAVPVDGSFDDTAWDLLCESALFPSVPPAVGPELMNVMRFKQSQVQAGARICLVNTGTPLGGLYEGLDASKPYLLVKWRPEWKAFQNRLDVARRQQVALPIYCAPEPYDVFPQGPLAFTDGDGDYQEPLQQPEQVTQFLHAEATRLRSALDTSQQTAKRGHEDLGKAMWEEGCQICHKKDKREVVAFHVNLCGHVHCFGCFEKMTKAAGGRKPLCSQCRAPLRAAPREIIGTDTLEFTVYVLKSDNKGRPLFRLLQEPDLQMRRAGESTISFIERTSVPRVITVTYKKTKSIHGETLSYSVMAPQSHGQARRSTGSSQVFRLKDHTMEFGQPRSYNEKIKKIVSCPIDRVAVIDGEHDIDCQIEGCRFCLCKLNCDLEANLVITATRRSGGSLKTNIGLSPNMYAKKQQYANTSIVELFDSESDSDDVVDAEIEYESE